MTYQLAQRQPLIGVTGRKRSGKDSFARVLVESYGFHRLGFADRLKRVLLEVDPLVRGDSFGCEPGRLSVLVSLLGWEAAKDTVEVRRLLQTLGTAVRDYLSEDAWVRPVLGEAHWRLAEGQQVVIPDVRFPNEADAIRAAGGLIVRLHRDPIGSSDIDTHVSETAMDDYPADVDIDNTGSFDSLRLAAAETVERVL